jgi:hypothetical protein
MSDMLDAATEISCELRNIDGSLEKIQAEIGVLAVAKEMPRRHALAQAIYLQMIHTVMTMRGIPSAIDMDGRRELAVAAWDLADELLGAEVLGGPTGANEPGYDEGDRFVLARDGGLDLVDAERDVPDALRGETND